MIPAGNLNNPPRKLTFGILIQQKHKVSVAGQLKSDYHLCARFKRRKSFKNRRKPVKSCRCAARRASTHRLQSCCCSSRPRRTSKNSSYLSRTVRSSICAITLQPVLRLGGLLQDVCSCRKPQKFEGP